MIDTLAVELLLIKVGNSMKNPMVASPQTSKISSVCWHWKPSFLRIPGLPWNESLKINLETLKLWGKKIRNSDSWFLSPNFFRFANMDPTIARNCNPLRSLVDKKKSWRSSCHSSAIGIPCFKTKSPLFRLEISMGSCFNGWWRFIKSLCLPNFTSTISLCLKFS